MIIYSFAISFFAAFVLAVALVNPIAAAGGAGLYAAIFAYRMTKILD